MLDLQTVKPKEKQKMRHFLDKRQAIGLTCSDRGILKSSN